MTLSAFILSAIVLSPNHALPRTAILAESLKAKRIDRKQLPDTLQMLSELGVLTLGEDEAYRIADGVIREVWNTEAPTDATVNPNTLPALKESQRAALARIESLQRIAFMGEYSLTEEDMGDSDIASLFREWVSAHPIELRDIEGYCIDRKVELADIPNTIEAFDDIAAYRNGDDIGKDSNTSDDSDDSDSLTEYSDSPEDFDIDDESDAELAEYDSAE